MRRRTLLGFPFLAGLGAASSCADTSASSAPRDDVAVQTLTYGSDPSQFLELSRPSGSSRGLVVVIHGGFWRAAYDLDLGRPLAASLAGQGWSAANIEYRRIGPASSGGGGGVPATFDDVRAAVATARAEVADGPLVVLGHSAGGHLAAWAGGRVDGITHVIAQAGVLDLVAATEEKLGDLAVEGFLGHPATAPGDLEWDPFQQLPLAVPLRCVHGTDDANVPISQSRDYVAAASEAGADAGLVEIEGGDHFTLIDVDSEAWAKTLGILDGISPR